MNSAGEKTPSNDEAIEAIAAAWLVQRDEGFTPEQAAAFARWQAANPKHADAVAMLDETCGILGKLPLVPSAADLRRAPVPAAAESAPPRRARILRFPRPAWCAAATAACLLVALVIWRRDAAEATFAQTYATATGGYLRVVLPDTSVLELNGLTEARIRFSSNERHVDLMQGEAHFTVAKNPARPFLVDAGRVAVRAVGTAFNVRRDKAAIEVLVTEGRVQVSQEAGTGPTPTNAISLADSPVYVAGQRIVVATADGAATRQVATLDAPGIRGTLAWQAPRLVFVDTPLFEVVRQFNAQNRVQLVVDDSALGQRPVDGTFRADHVETFVSLLETSGDITTDRSTPDRIILRKARSAP